jgi:hypothetical protein
VSAWDDLVTTALLGTGRRALPAGLPPAVARLCAAQPDPGLAVLDAAAGYASYRHAGARPATCPEPPIAPRQSLDLAPEPAQRLLGALLRSRDADLVDAWLTACTARGLGVRAGLWAALADAAAAPRGPDRDLVLTALGERGRAFVASNPRWQAVTRPAPTAAAALRPPSALLTERALAAVRVVRSLGRRRVSVQPPEHDQDLRAAGVPARPPACSRLDPAAHLLRRVVAGADPDAWQRHTGLEPAAFLDLLATAAPEWQADLLAGLAEAATARGHADWATALVRAGQAAPGLVALVPGRRLDAIAEEWARSRSEPEQVARLLGGLPGPWTGPVARAALRHLATGRLPAAASRRLALLVAHRAPLSVHDDMLVLARRERDAAQARGFGEAERVLATRIEIDRTFATGPGAGHPTEETA